MIFLIVESGGRVIGLVDMNGSGILMIALSLIGCRYQNHQKREKTMTTIEQKTIETPIGTKKTYYYDTSRMTEYRRIIGAVAWPSGEKLGFIVVIAEDYNKDPRLKLRHYRLLAEYDNITPERLVRRLYDFQNKYLVSPWYGEPDNLLMMHFVDKFNQGLSSKQKGIYIAEAPFADDPHNLRMYANQIKDRMIQAKKSLHFGDKSRIPGALSGLTPQDVQTKNAQEFPAVAALGFALSGLDESWTDSSEDRELHEQFIMGNMVEGL